jgi:hypothetical protein
VRNVDSRSNSWSIFIAKTSSWINSSSRSGIDFCLPDDFEKVC